MCVLAKLDQLLFALCETIMDEMREKKKKKKNMLILTYCPIRESWVIPCSSPRDKVCCPNRTRSRKERREKCVDSDKIVFVVPKSQSVFVFFWKRDIGKKKRKRKREKERTLTSPTKEQKSKPKFSEPSSIPRQKPKNEKRKKSFSAFFFRNGQFFFHASHFV